MKTYAFCRPSSRRGNFDNFGKMITDIINEGLTDVFEHDFGFNRPSANLFESEKDYQIDVAAPGLRKEDFKIEVKDDFLVVSVTREQGEDANRDWIRKGFDYSNFRRRFKLQSDADPEKIKAKYENGILHVKIPKTESGGKGFSIDIE